MAELKISDAEWVVMEVAWERKSVTAADVIAALSDSYGWNHRTIRTLLARLVEKAALKTESVGNKYVYRAAITRARCVRQESVSFVEKIFGGDVSSLLAHFVTDPKLSRDELQGLRKLLNERLDDPSARRE